MSRKSEDLEWANKVADTIERYCGIGCLMCLRSEAELDRRGHACGCVYYRFRLARPRQPEKWEDYATKKLRPKTHGRYSRRIKTARTRDYAS